jgi:hypothetical protein
MEENFNRELLEINYFKRWSALNVKILKIENSILGTNNELTQAWLRDYKIEQETIKQEEKQLLKTILL